MNHNQELAYVVRDKLLGLLSAAEMARVSTAETASRLSNGDDYVDLDDLALSVQRATGLSASLDRVLQRKALGENTWTQSLAKLAALRASTVRAT